MALRRNSEDGGKKKVSEAEKSWSEMSSTQMVIDVLRSIWTGSFFMERQTQRRTNRATETHTRFQTKTNLGSHLLGLTSFSEDQTQTSFLSEISFRTVEWTMCCPSYHLSLAQITWFSEQLRQRPESVGSSLANAPEPAVTGISSLQLSQSHCHYSCHSLCSKHSFDSARTLPLSPLCSASSWLYHLHHCRRHNLSQSLSRQCSFAKRRSIADPVEVAPIDGDHQPRAQHYLLRLSRLPSFRHPFSAVDLRHVS